MEQCLSGAWKLAADPRAIGEEMHYYLPEAFPRQNKPYWVPQFQDAKPFQGLESSQVWISREFELEEVPAAGLKLFSLGADRCRIWLNGKFQGEWQRQAGIQTLGLTNPVQGTNTLTIQLLELSAPSQGLWRDLYILDNNSQDLKIAHACAELSPSWLHSSVIYCIYTRNFSPKGDFESVRQRLPYLRDLGVNVLWLLPVHPIGKLKRKGSLGSPYAISDYYGINPEFGSPEDLRRLTAEAHALGFKVILDLVINHTAKDSVMKKHDPRFYKSARTSMADAWGWTDVSDLDYDHPPTRTYISDMMAYWVKELNLDGYRCDVAFLVPDSFWLEAIGRLRHINPEIMLLAESDVTRLHLAGFDLTYDWGLMALLRRISQGYFSYQDIPRYFDSQSAAYPQNALRMICTENHDTDRAAHQYQRQDLVAMQLIKFFLPGIPLVYNGEEAGIQTRPDLFEKDTVPWDVSIPGFVEMYRELCHLRRSSPALANLQPSSVRLESDDTHLTIQRTAPNETLLLEIVLPQRLSRIYKDGKLWKEYPALED